MGGGEHLFLSFYNPWVTTCNASTNQLLLVMFFKGADFYDGENKFSCYFRHVCSPPIQNQYILKNIVGIKYLLN